MYDILEAQKSCVRSPVLYSVQHIYAVEVLQFNGSECVWTLYFKFEILLL